VPLPTPPCSPHGATARPRRRWPRCAPSLTPRKWEIAKLAAAGLTNEQIANRLVVSIRTIHNHLHQAYTKLGVHHRAELGAVVQPPNPHT
jgi:DNA-binding NarL/FixJ family response regulator